MRKAKDPAVIEFVAKEIALSLGEHEDNWRQHARLAQQIAAGYAACKAVDNGILMSIPE